MYSCVGKNVTKSTFRSIEMKILTFFNFNVTVPTVAHFIEYYKEYYYYDKYFYNHEVPGHLKRAFDSMILVCQDLALDG